LTIKWIRKTLEVGKIYAKEKGILIFEYKLKRRRCLLERLGQMRRRWKEL